MRPCWLAHLYQVVDEDRKVRDAAVHVGGLVHPDQGLVEDGEEVAEQLESHRFFDQVQHHRLVPLPRLQLHQLLEVREELGALLELLVDVLHGVVECDVRVVEAPDLIRSQRRLDQIRPEDAHDDVDVVRGSLLPDCHLDVLVAVRILLELVDEHLVADLHGERVDGLLEVPDAVVECQEKIRCISDLAPNGCARKMSRTFDMTAAGLATRMTFLMMRVWYQRVDSLRLREELGRVVLGEEQMVDGGSYLYPQPLGEFLVLYAEVLDRLLLLYLLEEHREAVALDDVLPEPMGGKHTGPQRGCEAQTYCSM